MARAKRLSAVWVASFISVPDSRIHRAAGWRADGGGAAGTALGRANSGFARPLAKEGASDANHGGAFGDGDAVIVAHAHRQLIELRQGEAARAGLEGVAQGAKTARRGVCGGLMGADRHEAAQVQDPGERGIGQKTVQEGGHGLACQPLFGAIFEAVYADQNLQRASGGLQVACKRVGQRQAVEGVKPVEMGTYDARLVALHRTQKVPFEASGRKGWNFGHGLLRVVLTECPLSLRGQCRDRCGRLAFADGDEAHGAGWPAGALRAMIDILGNGIKCGHRLLGPRVGKAVLQASYWAMEEIGLLLKRIMPEVPDDLMTAGALAPLWAQVATGALARIRPLGYCRGRLFVAVPGSSFGARLKQEQPRLLATLRQVPSLAQLQEIVARPWPEAATPGTRREPLRPPSAPDCVLALALAVDDEALRASLARLAASMRGSGDSADPVV